jgi:hypothetical protein
MKRGCEERQARFPLLSQIVGSGEIGSTWSEARFPRGGAVNSAAKAWLSSAGATPRRDIVISTERVSGHLHGVMAEV